MERGKKKSKNGTDNPFRLQSVPFLRSKNRTDTPFGFVISKRKLFFDSFCICMYMYMYMYAIIKR